jgi:hypothetical protein
MVGGEYLSQRALLASGLIILAVIIILGPGKVRPREHQAAAALDPEASGVEGAESSCADEASA